MAIQLPNGFKIGSVEPIDTRLTLTKNEMLTINENTMPDHYFAICKDDDKLYVFDKANTLDPNLGKFRVYEATISESELATKLPGAISEAMQAEGGAEEILDAMFNTEHFQTTVDNKIDLAISLIQAVESN